MKIRTISTPTGEIKEYPGYYDDESGRWPIIPIQMVANLIPDLLEAVTIMQADGEKVFVLKWWTEES